MITNQMRIDLLILGWSKDEIRHLTPKECWEIIGKGVIRNHQGKGLGANSEKALV